MSNKASEGDEKEIDREPPREIEQEAGKKLELLEVKKDGSAKTFVYRDPDQGNKREGLWTRLLGKKSRSIE
ncbi:hypothetical protein H6F50_25665 [Coleofasciculus sp. FACHB-712]|uniref:hypothetical protein n=1 Tax=Coleofasciculus sp. FACHB-712 TaxID=2692789 RepID=UPI0016875528|nr:hypothetical protein [Coleofasciculus sp. FACHB-712]MBD1945697.1 hypothetical protein [Coleofasciculus sp. FACHB-712]